MLREKRLIKELIDLDKQPLQNALIKRDGQLNFHFCLFNLDDGFKDGFYHAVLQLHENYPFSPPKLLFYTPNGRYQINTPICTSFTNYHPESWRPIWKIKSLILATISFMYADQDSYGCRNDPLEIRKIYAKQSLQYNFKSQTFNQLFQDTLLEKYPQLKDRKINPNQPVEKVIQTLQIKKQNEQPENIQIDLINEQIKEPVIGLQYQQNKKNADGVDKAQFDIHKPNINKQQSRKFNQVWKIITVGAFCAFIYFGPKLLLRK